MKNLSFVSTILILCVMVFSITLHNKSIRTDDKIKHPHGKLTGVDKQLAMWYFSKGYPDPTGLDQKYAEAWRQFLQIRNPEIRSTAAGVKGSAEIMNGSNWRALGPKVIGGRVLSVAISPTNSNNIFIGTASGGIWKTVTAGTGATAWTYVPTGYQTLGVSSIVYHPTNSNILLAGTGEVYRVDYSGTGRIAWKTRGTYGVGILKSTDGGSTWTQVYMKYLSDLFAIQKIFYDPNNSNTVYAAATDGLYKSTDGGSNWVLLYSKVYVSDIVVQSGNSDNMMIAVGNLTNPDKGIYRTTNGGMSWTKLTNATHGVPSSFMGMIKFAYLSGNTIYAGIAGAGGSTSSSNLYVSTNFGSSWSVKGNSAYNSYQHWFANALAINPADNNQMILGGVNLFSYNLSGSSRSQINSTSAKTGFMMPGDQESNSSSYVHSDIHDIKFVGSTNTFYVACDGGMFRSTNGGASFQSLNGGLQIAQFYPTVAQSATDPNFFVGGLQDNNTAVYNGVGWKRYFVGDGGAAAIDQTNDNYVYVTQDARRLGRSINKASSGASSLLNWTSSTPPDDRTAFIAPMALSPSNPNVLYIASDNLHRTNNAKTSGTPSFTNTGTPPPANYIDGARKTAIALAVSDTDPDKLYISTSSLAQYANDNDNVWINPPPRVFKCLNGTAATPTFQNISSGLPDRFTMDFAISPTNDDSVFIAMGGFGAAHIYVTGNGGATWTPRSIGLPDVPFNCIIFDPNNTNFIYAGCDLGVYVSPNRGATWYDFNIGLDDATLVVDLVITPTNILRAATHGKGILESNLAAATLPLKIKNFSGKALNQFNQLSWVTFAEVDVLKIDLQRSLDGNIFTTISSFDPVNRPGENVYSYNDYAIDQSSDIYYKLKIIDRDEKFVFSNVVFLRPATSYVYKVIHDRSADALRIISNSKDNYGISIVLLDANGRSLFRKNQTIYPGTQSIAIENFARLPKGMYFLHIRNSSGGIFTSKVVK